MTLLYEEKQIYKGGGALLFIMDCIKRGQTSIEYLILIGFILIALIPIFYYALSESSNTVRLNEAEDSVNTLAKAADSVYALGPGTKNYVWVNFPGGIDSISFSDKRVLIKLNIFGGLSDIYVESKAELTGSISITQGGHRIKVEALDSGEVRFSEG